MKCFFTLLVFLASLPAMANPAISVQQLTDIIVFAQAHNQSDKDVARKIGNMQLAQRLGGDALTALLGRVQGPKTKEALQTLADESSFLDPPASEFLDEPVPALEEQKTGLEKARSYADSYIRKLPNFFCTLVMRRFDDGNGTQYLRLNDVLSGDLTFNGGKELTAVRAVNGIRSTEKLPTHGLTTHDEVGGLLASIFADDGGLKAVWSHWENVNGTSVAVFRYALDKAHSHFTVSYCCSPGVVTAPVTIITASTGELSIDLATGAVLRVTEQAVDIPKGFAVQKAAVMVEYATVQIGSASFICPIRSVSISDLGVHEASALDSFSLSGTRHSLNEMLLTNYHEFGAASRIVAGGAAQAVENPSASKVAAPVPVPAPDETETARETLPPAGQQDIPKSLEISPPEQTPEQPSAAPAASASAETAPSSQPLADTSFKVRVNVVTVHTVVRDGQGHYVGDLQKNEFDLSDNSKRQVISGFSVEKAETSQKPKQQLAAPNGPSGQASNEGSAEAHSNIDAPNRYVVYLLTICNRRSEISRWSVRLRNVRWQILQTPMLV